MNLPGAEALRAPDPWRAGTLSLAELPPLALYVHLPWCLRKCPYCDFNSHEALTPQGAAPETQALWQATQARYLQALHADLQAALPLVWGRRVSSVFIGGGTPSLFSPQAVDTLLAQVRALLPMEPGAEVTLEANPGTFERDRFAAYRQAGVTRLSIGVQSFDDEALKRLGRVHDAAQAHAAVQEAARCFDTFNLDLMYALPGQDLAALRRDLRTALACHSPHLSVYHLSLEPNTIFAAHPPQGLPDEDLAAAMLDEIVSATAEAGLQRYEVSAFARGGHRCRHNLNYWRFGDYLGIGAGAHGKISFAHRIVRQVRWRDPATYMEKALSGAPVSNEHEIKRQDLPFEYVLNALRLPEGFAISDFCARTGLPASVLEGPLQKALGLGLLQVVGEGGPQGSLSSVAGAAPQPEWQGRLRERLVPTPKGFDFLSDLQALFLPGRRPGPPRTVPLRPG